MWRTTSLLIVAWLTSASLHAQVLSQDPDRAPVIATSGHVEIASIRIVRQKASGAAKDADLTNMEVALWLTREAAGSRSGDYLVRLLALAPVEDNTGKTLSTKSRLNAIDCLHGEVSARQTRTYRGKKGPVISIVLEAPARNATAIKALKGKASLSQSDFARLQFDDLAAINGKVLEHPKLKEFPIRLSVKVDDGYTRLTLAVPKQHARLADWGLGQKKRLLPVFSESQSPAEDAVVLEKTYHGDHLKTAFLGILLGEPSETKTLDFEFSNLELP